MLGLFTEMSTATVSMWLTEWGVIDPDSLSDRKQPTPPLLCQHHREEALKEGTGWAWRLDWQLQQWGLSGHAAPLPFKAQAGGHTKSSPRPWPPQVAFVAHHHGLCSTALPPAHYQSQTPSGSSVCVCSFVYTFTDEYTCMSSYTRAHWKKVCSSKSAWNGSTRVMIYEDVLAQNHDLHLDQGRWGV